MTPRHYALAVVALGLGTAMACGIELQTATGSGADGGADTGALPDDVGASSGEPAAPGDFVLDGTTISETDCGAERSKCLGTATVVDSRIVLTSAAKNNSESTGVFWHRLDLERSAAFTLTIDVSTEQPPGGGKQGHGFAFAFVQANAGGAGFPPLSTPTPNLLGVGLLEGFSGAAAYVKTYDAGKRGVFGLRTTQIPAAITSGDNAALDDWNTAPGNDETFSPTDATFLHFVIERQAGADPTATLYRCADSSFSVGDPLHTVTIPLAAMTRLDFFGIGAARGNDAYSQSGHRIERIALTSLP